MGTEINKPVQKQKLQQSEARPGKTFLKRTTVEEMKTWADKATRSCFSFLKWKKNSWCNSQVYMFVTRPNPERFWTNSGFALWHFKPATCNFTANVWCGVGSWHRSYIDHAVVPSVCVCTLLTPRSESTVFIWVRLPHSQLLESWLMLYVKQPPLTISHLEGNFSPSFLLSSSFSHAFSGLQSSTVGLLHSLYVHIKRSFLKKKKKKMLKKRKCQAAVQSNDTK